MRPMHTPRGAVTRSGRLRLAAAADQTRGNLPRPLTTFIGRSVELARVSSLIGQQRLVTIAGPGGVGKSRLALEAALQVDARDGVWLIDLAGVQDGALIARSIAAPMEITAGPLRSLERALAHVLAERELVLVLDNCEHLVTDCQAVLPPLLQAAPGLRVLATSRVALGCMGEQVLDLAPLDVPRAGSLGGRPPAVQLFVDRAQSVRSHFALHEADLPLMHEICRRLDGMPLALELAAARLRTMTLSELADELKQSLESLADDPAQAGGRWRSLNDMIQWSWDLLSPAHHTLLSQLSVFRSGWTLEAAEAITGGAPSTGRLLRDLVAHSLVVLDELQGRSRYRMHETIRQFAEERLVESGRAVEAGRHHQDYFLGRLAASDPEIFADDLAWLERMDAEIDNIRAALDWCRQEPETVERALQASYGLWFYWDYRANTSEERSRFRELLDLHPGPEASLGKLLGTLFLAHTVAMAGDFSATMALLKQAHDLNAQVRHSLGSFWLACMMLQAEVCLSQPSLQTVEALCREIESGPSTLSALFVPWLRGVALFAAGETEEAATVLTNAVQINLLPRLRAIVLTELANLQVHQGNLDGAEINARKSIEILTQYRDWRIGAIGVALLGAVAAGSGQWERAARLLGGVSMLADLTSRSVNQLWRASEEQTIAAALTALGQERFRALYEAGRSMSVETVFACALQPARSESAAGPLSERERQVADLVVAGLTNRQIAERLVIGTRTVDSHVSNIIRKLDLTNRAQLAAWAQREL
ncbi:MAG TPA: LuxR C-terminal-related transcriptional regulator [Chloroflexota bacterium]|nr:LuxR C-terminal-related transcriptional regulator [Chloroflexota bacterium]